MLIKRRFGVEIEAVGVTSATLRTALRNAGLEAEITARFDSSNAWKIKRDGSLFGAHPFELVSPILTGEEGLMELHCAVRIAKAKGADVNRSCGLHVHVEALDFDLAAIKRLAKSYANNEDIFDALMPSSRRASMNQYTRSVYGLTHTMTDAERVEAVARFFRRVDEATTIQQVANTLGSRYVKLNLLSIAAHGTIEFRHHSGTVNPDKIVAWVKFCQAFVEHAHKARAIRPWGVNRMTKTARLKTVLTMLGAKELYPYYRDRIKELKRSTD